MSLKKVAKWIVPIDTKTPSGEKLEALVEKVISENKEVRQVFKTSIEKNDYLRTNLKYSIQDSYEYHKNLRRFSQYIDTIDKTLVPIDIVADTVSAIAYPIGVGVSWLKEMVELGPKIAYLAYYTAKTKDFVGAMGSLLYEGISSIMPGSLLDLTNKYTKQADKYVLKRAANDFLVNIGVKEQEPMFNKVPAFALKPA
ncbi:MAG: hypothetical protein KKF89_02060 [Nanoarchaeota archaeon]|nr:hypothetical protein [Nanoarchaeota archaeon]MBU1854478.1 hypothetical protein [Nanoarchaeota archaeon]